MSRRTGSPLAEAIYAAVPGTATERLVSGRPGDRDLVALVWKRAFRIGPTGECIGLDEAVPIEDDSLPWGDEAGALGSPPRTESDLFAFKPATDLVVQGHVYTHGRAATVEAELKTGAVSRTVRAIGERRAVLEGGQLRFTPPEPFERLPLRYDRAYGGCDRVGLARLGDPIGDTLRAAEPRHEEGLAASTPCHYPRNPTGRGFLISADAESIDALRVPNLEFPFDPVTPERLAVGDPLRWLGAPLPACMDWVHPAWFPRIAYFGFVPEHVAPAGSIPEVARGWAPREILSLRRSWDVIFDPRFQQGASPGLSIADLAPDAELTLRHVFPGQRERRVRLPGRLPSVRISLGSSDTRAARTRLNAVIVRPDEERVVLVYAASCEARRRYGNHELAAMRWSVAR